MPTKFYTLSGGEASALDYREKHSLRVEPAAQVHVGIFWVAEIVAMQEAANSNAMFNVINAEGEQLSNPEWGIVRWWPDVRSQTGRPYYTNDWTYNVVERFSLQEAENGIYTPNKPENGRAPMRYWLYGPNLVSEAAWFGSIDNHITQAVTIRVTPTEFNPAKNPL